MNTLRISLPSRFQSVAAARHAVAAFARRCGIGMVDVSDLMLAVGEACNNAVEHGHVAGGEIAVDCVHEQGVLKVAVSDAGPGFMPTDQNAPADGSMAYIGRGRGIQIMRALMDRVTFGSNAGGTTVVLEKRAPAASLSSGPGSRAASRSASGDREARREVGRIDARDGGQPL